MRSLAAILLSLACGTLPARAADCPSGNAVVTVDLPTAGIRVEQVRDVSAYAAFAAGASSGPVSGGNAGYRWTINGLTKSLTQVGFQIEGLSSPGCFTVTKVGIKIAVGDPVQVLITDKYAPGTCQYQAILEHEMQHVDILRQGRIIYAERYKQFAQIASGQGPFSDIGQANQRISGMMDVVSDEMKRALGVANASIDTAESYLANQSRCPGW